MNKKERAALDAATMAALVNRALRWSPETSIAPDVPKPDSGDSEGWTFNSYDRGRVERAWSSSVSHGTYYNGKRSGGTQQGIRLYSTEALALRAMRCEMEARFARILAAVDMYIAKAEAK